MRIVTSLTALRCPPDRAVVTIGMFDGVHVGHQRLMRTAVRLAHQRHGTSVVLTFDPDPQRVLAPTTALPPMMPLPHRLELMRALDIDLVWVIPFTRRFARITPEAFVRRIVLARLQAQCVVVGSRFAFGAGRQGDVALMARVGAAAGLRVVTVPPVQRAGAPVSSSRIRRLLQCGDVEMARQLLGRPSQLSGCVVRGRGVGHRLGVPTANVQLDAVLPPATGVYAVRVWRESCPSTRWHGVMNFGHRPTFLPAPRYRQLLRAARLRAARGQARQAGGGGPLTCEVHVPGLRMSWYGRRVRMDLLRYLRPERRFASPHALVQQIHRDLTAARL